MIVIQNYKFNLHLMVWRVYVVINKRKKRCPSCQRNSPLGLWPLETLKKQQKAKSTEKRIAGGCVRVSTSVCDQLNRILSRVSLREAINHVSSHTFRITLCSSAKEKRGVQAVTFGHAKKVTKEEKERRFTTSDVLTDKDAVCLSHRTDEIEPRWWQMKLKLAFRSKFLSSLHF